jgi:hypothetical protein
MQRQALLIVGYSGVALYIIWATHAEPHRCIAVCAGASAPFMLFATVSYDVD